MGRPVSSNYRVFTRRFDRVVEAKALDLVLGPLAGADLDAVNDAWRQFAEGPEHGNESPVAQSGDGAAFVMLLDQSGSMKGRPMVLAAQAIEIAVSALHAAGCAVEVLGFTTASWRGGWPRRLWNWMLRPKQPGRLCELLHVIYRSADEQTAQLSETAIRSMLRPDLPKENVDGEAILWAADRLRSRPEGRKVLIVLSDGSPVDDSTQQANGPLYLDEHLASVLSQLKDEGDITVAAVGIGYDVSGWYPTSVSTSAATLKTDIPAFVRSLASNP